MNVTAFGVVAAVILLASFVLRGEKKIRIVNLVGCQHHPVAVGCGDGVCAWCASMA